MFELSLFKLLVWAAWASAAGWLAALALTLIGLARHKPLRRAAGREFPTTGEAPLVSVLVPARNEEGRVLAASVRSILAQDYERLEVVAVNDRSTDATGTILRGLAEEDRRLRVIDGAEPPAGWLGKDEIYAELVLSQNLAPGTGGPVQILKRAKTPVKQIDA